MLYIPPDAGMLIIVCWNLHSLLMILISIFYLLLKNQYLLCLFLNHLWTHYPFVLLSLFLLLNFMRSLRVRSLATLIEFMDPKKAKGEVGITVPFFKACPSGMARLIV